MGTGIKSCFECICSDCDGLVFTQVRINVKCDGSNFDKYYYLLHFTLLKTSIFSKQDIQNIR